MQINREKLNCMMAKSGMAMRDLAQKMEVSAARLSQILSGKESLRPKTVHRVATALECEVENII